MERAVVSTVSIEVFQTLIHISIAFFPETLKHLTTRHRSREFWSGGKEMSLLLTRVTWGHSGCR
jgi:hypothetical protein